MNRLQRIAFSMAIAAMLLFSSVNQLQAQAQKPASPTTT